MNPAPQPQTEPRHDAPSAGAGPAAARGAAWLAGGVALFLFALYPGVVLGTHSFFDRDFGLFTYPVAYYAHQSIWRGEVPLWNPLIDTGVPFLAQWNTTVCYPLSLIYLLFPLPWSLNDFCLLHLMLAGAGMYLLAYDWTRNRVAAGVAGIGFALNGLMLNCLIWTSNLASLAWMPWVLLLVEKAWRHGGSRRLAIAALAGAMQMLAGAPEVILFTWILLGTLWLGQAWGKHVPFGSSLRRFLVLITLVTGLSAIQLFPFLDLLAHAQRDASYAIADAWPMPAWGWASYVVPQLHCSQTALGSFTQNGQSWTSSYYVGIGALALAAVGAGQRQNRRAWWAAGVALAGLVLALGRNGLVYTWLKQAIPWIGVARYPIKFVTLPTLTLPLLAAYGVARVQSADAHEARRSEKILWCVGGFLLLAVAAVLGAAREFQQPGDSWTDTWHSGVSRALFLAALVAGMTALRRLTGKERQLLLGLAVVALAGLDVTTAGMRLQPTVSNRAFGPLELNMSFRPRFGQSRAMVSRQARVFLGNADQPDPLYYYVGVRGALFDNCNLLEGIPKVDGFCSLHLRAESETLQLLYDSSNAVPAGLADFLGVAQITAPDTVFAWQPRAGFLPLITGGQKPAFADTAETLRALGAADFHPRSTVFLPEAARGKIASLAAVDARIGEQTPSAQQLRFRVESAAPAMVVIAQTYSHNWRAFLDGHPTVLWQANHAYQALEVPAGRHEVVLRYRDRAFGAGWVVTAATALVCVTGWLAAGRRRSGATEAPP